MSKRVVLMRAVNVGGARLPMAQLREVAEELGATDVSTFIASGNLLVDVEDAEAFDRALEQAIQERFGFFREAISRSPQELRDALAAHPFEIDTETKANHVYFLLRPPAPEQVEALLAKGLPDALAVIGRDLHIRYAEGVVNTKLTPAFILKTLGSHGTGRNLNTVEKLTELAHE
ncbi:DUF1697 domain-containing protein [Aeromicrobium duanguangcaii]|uniref:DUF1697 domain-containing protein n=1 Tax=Aeromicrobium duanguangcaii TaxID=2968086 RepID=UPI0020179D2D|nr:DUF1697 domain-containing protein [Aeromicrobium duanguangcaii]MCL3838235.1 DUF1697 domain-containing protein [Aeromicrobium duanguangcaii]